MQFNEDSVLTLGANNFSQALENYPRVLVKFYAPWCGHCQAIAPEFAAAADSLAEQGFEAKLAQVDAVEHENLAAEHGVEGYPTFLWFDAANKDEDGDVEPHEYRGGRERADFAAFVMRRSGEPSDEIVDALAAAQWAVSFASAHEDRIGGSRSRAVSGRNLASISAGIGILTYLPVASLLPAYEQAIQAYVEVATFAHTTDATVYAAAVKAASDLVPDSSAASASADGKQPAALLLKPFDERAAALPPTDADGAKLSEALASFVRAHTLPLIVPFTERYEETLLEGSNSATRKQLIVYGTRAALSSRQAALRAVAMAFRGLATVVFADVSSDESDGLLEYFNIERANLEGGDGDGDGDGEGEGEGEGDGDGEGEGSGTLGYFGFDAESEAKYGPPPELAPSEGGGGGSDALSDAELEAVLARFLGEVVEDRAARLKLSEPLPEHTHDGSIRVVVADSFDEIVMAKGTDVLLQVYAPWCGHSKALAPEYEALARRLKSASKTLTIAKIDGSKNEVPDLEVDGYPTLLLFTASNERIELDPEEARTELTADGIEAWLHRHAELPFGEASKDEL